MALQDLYYLSIGERIEEPTLTARNHGRRQFSGICRYQDEVSIVPWLFECLEQSVCCLKGDNLCIVDHNHFSSAGKGFESESTQQFAPLFNRCILLYRALDMIVVRMSSS